MSRNDAFHFKSSPVANEPAGIIAILIGLVADDEAGRSVVADAGDAAAAYDPGFTGGIFVAAGDVTGDAVGGFGLMADESIWF